MSRPPGGIGRLALTLFVGAVVFAVAQVGWWIYFLVRLAPDRRHVLMFASEGAFFLLIALAGFALIYRALKQHERLRQMRTTFLSAVTHELKSPLAAIRLFLETLEEGKVDEAKRQDLVRKMLLDVARLDRLVADLLRAGQIETGAIQPALEEVDVHALVEEAVEAARRHLAPGDSIEIWQPPSGVRQHVSVRADRMLLRSAIDNLLDNATKYPAPPRRIVASALSGSRGAQISVADSGPRIDHETAERLFEPFQRGGDELVRRTKGAGLGLFIVRGIVEAHGGEVYFDDAPFDPPPGNVIVVSLPDRGSRA